MAFTLDIHPAGVLAVVPLAAVSGVERDAPRLEPDGTDAVAPRAGEVLIAADITVRIGHDLAVVTRSITQSLGRGIVQNPTHGTDRGRL